MDFTIKLKLQDVIRDFGFTTIDIVSDSGESRSETFENIDELERAADAYELEFTVYYEV